MQWDSRYQREFAFSQLDSPGWLVSGPLLHFQLFPLCPPELLPASRFFSLDFYQDSTPFQCKFSKSGGANMSFKQTPPRGSRSRWILPEILFSWWSPPCFCWLIKKEFYVCFQQKNHFCANFFDDRMVKIINKTWNSTTIKFCESFCDSYLFERGTWNLSHFATMLGFFQGWSPQRQPEQSLPWWSRCQQGKKSRGDCKAIVRVGHEQMSRRPVSGRERKASSSWETSLVMQIFVK